MGHPSDPTAGLSPLKRALLALDDMKARLDAAERPKREPIAIIGMGCRFPGGAVDADSFWRVVRDGVDTVCEVPKARWDVDAYYDPDPSATGKTYVRRGAFLDEFDRFDPQFFGIAPREAAGMDPQQRLLLEVTWEALEDAAVPPEQAARATTGVFVGINSMDYAALQLQRSAVDRIDAYSLSGTAHSIAAGRLAYVLGLQGPAVAVDTACSSSLVAVHLACQSLRNDECRMALAGGVQITLSPLNSVVFSKLRMLAADGRCKAFDARGDGFVEGEGCAVLVLKRLSHAVADGDRILALIRGSAVNQDGASSGLTAPNGPSQESVIRAALERGGVSPSDVDYVEAHGTGTALGDPIEVQALAAVLGADRAPERPLLIGSVKTNLGHTQAAAGVAGLVKLALALDREAIPPSLHFEQPNPHIPWSALPVKVVTEATPWPRGRARRIGGVSSFGFSGTNAHIVLEEAPAPSPAPQETGRPLHVLAMSARSGNALETLAGRWAERVRASSEARLEDVAFTANAGRAHLAERAAVIAGTRDEALAQLSALAEGLAVRGARGRAPADRPKVAFLCTGQGAQYAGMGRQLYDTQPVFRQALDACADLLRGELDRPLLSVLYPPSGADAAIDQTAYAQPALFAIEYALAQLWKSWGVVPDALLGHSIGEYVAACLAGVFTLEDAVKLVALRGRLMQSLPAGGAMAAVFADDARVRAAAALAGRISIAAVNAPDNVVVSGPARELDDLLARLGADGVSSERLNVSHAFHSALMEPILDEFERAVAAMTLGAPRTIVVSNLSGQPARGEIRTAEYWRRHLREAVLFARGVEGLREMGFGLFLEIGPRPTLSSLAARSLPQSAVLLPSLRKAGHDWTRMLESVAELYVRGVEVDWTGFDRPYARRKLPMPTYPFERERHWLPGLEPDAAPAETRRAAAPGAGSHPLLGRRLSSALSDVQFESEVSVGSPAFLADHCKRGTAVFPATAYLEAGLAAAREALGGGSHAFNELVIGEPLALSDEPRTLQTVIAPDGAGGGSFRLFSREEDGGQERWRLHGTGTICPAPEAAHAGAAVEDIEALKSRCAEALPVEEHYARLLADGHEYGPAFRGVTGLWRGNWEALGALRLPAHLEDERTKYLLHPALLDAGLQVMAAAVPAAFAAANGETYLPVSLGRCAVHAAGAGEVWSHVRVTPPAGPAADGFTADVRLYDGDGRLVAEVLDIYHKRLDAAALAAAARKRAASWLYETAWREAPRESAADASASGTWVVVSQDADSAAAGALSDALAQRGATVLRIACNAESRESDRLVRVDPSSPEDFARALERARSLAPDVRAIVDVTSAEEGAAASSESPHVELRARCGALLHLVQALDGADFAVKPRLVLVTRGAVAVRPPEPVAAGQAPVWAIARTIGLEHPDVRCACIDLDPAGGDGTSLLSELLTGDLETQVAIRGGQRYVARLVRSAAAMQLASADAPPGPVSIEIAERGVLDRLELRPCTRQAPGPGQVEIKVRAAGLNFRDVLNALGVYEGDAGPLGNECVGTVVAVGPGVTHLKVGDDVLGMVPASFRTYVTAPAGPLVVKPAALSAEDAATVPIAFLTADYALNTLGRMRAGERVLIHAAAGGVGLAAVQLARRAGAEIFATAGSPEKHAYLRSLGVRHIFSSRSLDFADRILEATAGQGVDVVLNSLAGDFIARSLAVLGPNGRFLEIGKAGIWSAERMREARPDVEYHPIYFSPDDHPRVRQMLSDLLEAMASGSLAPLPRRSFPIEEAVAAFRYMAQARHIGKIVLVFDAAERAAGPPVSGDATYLVTGGTGALGLAVARWMVDAGARHVVLASRGRPSEPAAAAIAALAPRATVRVLQADVGREQDVQALLAQIAATMPPLGGIVHAAGVVDDGLLAQQTTARFETVLGPKADGAWLLHRHTRQLDLDFFVLFSSMVSLLGGPGQGNYAAANAFLDGLAEHRRAAGLPALSIQWGPWEGAGMANRVPPRDRQRWRDQGFGTIPPAEGVFVLDHLIRRATAANVAVLPLDWSKWFQQFPAGGEPPLVREIAEGYSRRAAAPAPARRRLLAEVARLAPNRRRATIEAFLREEALKVLGLDPLTAVDARQPLHELGLDSLMAVELRNTIAAALERTLPATLLFKHPTLDALADFVLSVAGGTADPRASAPQTRAGGREGDDRFDQLTDEETKALLAEELKSLALSGFGPDEPGS